MPGWMGLRGIKANNPHEQERQRRESQRLSAAKKETQILHRSQEKIQEILKDQDGDMSDYMGHPERESHGNPFDCDRIALMPVREIMSRRVAVLNFDDTVLTIQGIFAKVRFHHLPVVGPEGEVIGIISDRDFLRTVSPFFGTINEQNRDKEIMARRAGMIMTRNPVCLDESASLLAAVKLMNSRKISCLPIVYDGTMRLLGIVTWKDVVRAFCPQGFTSDTDSRRLKSGVSAESLKSESQRLKAAAHPETPAVHHSDATPGSSQSPDTSDLTSAVNSHEQHPVSLDHPTPHIAAQEKLAPRNLGQSGSDLASRQMERMRKQYGGKSGE